ncbi:MAG TPA: SDR family oxidoreductase [Ktedonobacteraceae bacterium]|jgi:NAD(P)-dependent dehydrogenase (short-subunit alcohol dehydrogenase family)|nr:SDR family oxidoreductase [Ktedonobacteraceae bacterium]
MTQQPSSQPPKQYQHSDIQEEMPRKPQTEASEYRASGKLQGKVALITGGDSGIGQAVAVTFAKEGADVAIVYLNEHRDAEKTKQLVEQQGRRCITVSGDVGNETFCQQAVEQTVQELGHLDILVNNAAEQHSQSSIEEISEQQLERTFRSNIFSMFFLTKAALKHLGQGSAIINTASVAAYKGSPELIDYASTKGAIVAFTRSLSQALVQQGIRVNGVAPGPIWTPLIPATMPSEKVKQFGAETPMQRAGQPEEVAPSYVFLASNDSSYMTGQVLHVNGGTIVNS